MADQDKDQTYWRSPGSGQYVHVGKGQFQYKALRAYNLSVEAIRHEDATAKNRRRSGRLNGSGGRSLEPHSRTDDSPNARAVLEGQLRECFGRVVYSHKTHEKCADRTSCHASP